MRSRPRRTTVVAVWLLAATAGSGCSVVDEPGPGAWDTQAEQALSDAASEVATVRLALDTAERRRTWASYAVVVVTEAEEAVGTVEDDLARLQVPPSREEEAVDVLALLEEATSAVRDARALAVEGDFGDARTLSALADLAAELTSAAGAV